MAGYIKRTDPDKREYYATPDHTRCMFKKGNFINVIWTQRDAIPFAIFGNDVYVGRYEESHFDLFDRNELFNKAGTVTVQGRIWTDKKIVSTWENFTSDQAKKVIDAFKQQANINIKNYYFLCDVDFEGKGKGIVYGIPMDYFASKGVKATDLPNMYERQSHIGGGHESPVDAQFSFNGVSGRLGRYLTTTWGDSVERDDLRVIVSEALNEVTDNIYKQTNDNMDNKTKVIKLTESQLRDIVKECVKTMLNENNLEELMNTIDAEIKKVGDAHVSRFYSDENYITVAVHQDCGSWARNEVTKTMRKYGYDCYDMGGNGNYVMITYRKL